MPKEPSLLDNWTSLNRELMNLDEKAVEALIKEEQKGRARLRVMVRLYHRFSKLRSTREKVELAQRAKA